jgi:hypothetical protein
VNKRLIAFLPILSLFLSLPLIPAHAEVKFGYECSKAGITDVGEAGRSYTCVEFDVLEGEGKNQKVVGKVLKWNYTAGNEGKVGETCSKAGITSVDSGRSYKCTKVEIVQGAGKSAKVVGTRLVWMLNDVDMSGRCNPPVKKITAPTPTPVKKKAKTFQSIAPIKSADYPLIGTLAKNTILNQKGSVHNPFVIYLDPTTTDFKRKFYSEQVEIMKKYFSPLVPNNSKAHIYILGSNKEWACKEVFKKAPDGLVISTMYQVSSKCETTPVGAITLDAAHGADYTTYKGAGGGLSVLGHGFGMVALSNCDEKNISTDLLFHEAFHAIQWIYTSFKLDSKEALKIPKVTGPIWMVEGSAQYMGALLSADGIWTSFGADERGWIYFNNGNWKKSYKEFDNYEPEVYNIGAVMYEYLLAKYGLERTLSFWSVAINSLSTKDFSKDLARATASKKAFQTVFGLSVEDFLNEVKPYIEWSLEQADRVTSSSQSNSGNSSGGAKPTETQKPTTSTDIGNPAFQEPGAKCDPSKEASGKAKDGTPLMCIAVSATAGSWQKK